MSVNRLSRILGPFKITDPRLVNANHLMSLSTKVLTLFSEQGLVRLQEGGAVLSPLMVRAMRKLENILHEEMEKLSACEISLPSLVSATLLEATGHNTKTELFKLMDRSEREYVLAPTNEEAITHLLSGETNLREASLPLRFYQISSKFRDEARPKHGLIRSKEFVMKDMYCFDKDSENRDNTYNEVKEQYHSIFQRLEVPYICVRSSGSDMLGKESHEFHFFSAAGEDDLILCKDCEHNVNINLTDNKERCSNCSSNNIKILKGIEVGHTFNIGTAYSKKLEAYFINKEGKRTWLEMGSYGIGVSRILGAAVEILSTETHLRWPRVLAPFSVCIIPPKAGSKESILETVANNLYSDLNQILKGDIVIDDRLKYTIGKRITLDKILGFPFIIVIGSEMLKDSPKVEVFDVNEDKNHLLSPSDVVSFVLSKINQKV